MEEEEEREKRVCLTCVYVGATFLLSHNGFCTL